MARVVSPFLSMDASGSVGKTLTAAKWKGRNYMKQWFKPANPRSPAQVAIRTVMANAIVYWNAGLGSADAPSKLLWETHGAKSSISGFNAFVSAYMKANYDSDAKAVEDPEVVVVVPGA